MAQLNCDCRLSPSVQAILAGRQDCRDGSCLSYKLMPSAGKFDGPQQFGMDAVYSTDPGVDESDMSFILHFADGNRLDVLPSFTVNDVADGSSTDLGVAAGQLTHAPALGVKSTNLAHMSFGQDGVRAFFALKSRFFVGPVYKHVLDIARSSIPAKVFQSVIRSISVRKVATFHTFRTWTNKCLQYETVYSSPVMFAFFLQVHKRVPRFRSSKNFDGLAVSNPNATSVAFDVSVQRPNVSPGRDLVIPFIARDVFPGFFRGKSKPVDRVGDKMRLHGAGSSITRVVLAGRPPRTVDPALHFNLSSLKINRGCAV